MIENTIDVNDKDNPPTRCDWLLLDLSACMDGSETTDAEKLKALGMLAATFADQVWDGEPDALGEARKAFGDAAVQYVNAAVAARIGTENRSSGDIKMPELVRRLLKELDRIYCESNEDLAVAMSFALIVAGRVLNGYMADESFTLVATERQADMNHRALQMGCAALKDAIDQIIEIERDYKQDERLEIIREEFEKLERELGGGV